jgi:PEP-CTERM motif-containing protein
MKYRFGGVVLAAMLSLSAMSTAEAAVILDTDYVWTETESTLSTRIFRDAVGTTWANFGEAFSGTTGVGAYRFTTFSVSVGDANYLRLTLTTPVDVYGYNAMIAGYQGSFNPADLSSNWLGDPGYSTGGPPVSNSFEVIAAQNSTFVVLLLQVNDDFFNVTGATSHVRVDAFMDANETEPPPATVPEPTSLSLLGTGLGAAAVLRRRRAARV